MAAPPGQFIALQAFNDLREILSGYVLTSQDMIDMTIHDITRYGMI